MPPGITPPEGVCDVRFHLDLATETAAWVCLTHGPDTPCPPPPTPPRLRLVTHANTEERTVTTR